MAGNRIYGTNLDGKTFVFEANPDEFKPIATNQLGDEVYASPVVSGNRLYLRVAFKTASAENSSTPSAASEPAFAQALPASQSEPNSLAEFGNKACRACISVLGVEPLRVRQAVKARPVLGGGNGDDHQQLNKLESPKFIPSGL